MLGTSFRLLSRSAVAQSMSKRYVAFNLKSTTKKSSVSNNISSTTFKRSYIQKQGENPDFTNPYQNDKEALRQLQTIEVIKGVFQGTGFLILVFGGFILYSDYGYYRTRFNNFINGTSDLPIDHIQGEESDDKKAKKSNEYIKFNHFKDSNSVPGVYLWGSNSDAVVNPFDLKVKNYKFPTRLSFFDGIVLKDLKINTKLENVKDDLNMYLSLDSEKLNSAEKNFPLNKNNNYYSSGFAIDANGDLIQWGKGFNEKDPRPQYTLRGHKLTRGEFSNNMIYLMNDRDELYYIPVNFRYQKLAADSITEMAVKSPLWLLWSTKRSIGLRKLETANLFGKNEKIVDFKTGVNHLVMLSSDYKAYVSATGLKGVIESDKNFGQFGLLEYSQFENAPEPNKLHEVFLLNNEIISKHNGTANALGVTSRRPATESLKVAPRKITQIATGNYHTLAKDSIGNVYSFGKNTFGQLGFQVSYNTENVPIPRKVEFFQQYFNKSNFYPIVTDIQACSDSSFVTLITKNIQEVFQKNYLEKGSKANTSNTVDDEEIPKIYFAFGKGLYGQLGIDYYVHANAVPKKMQSLHNLTEYNERAQKLQPIMVSDWAIGKNHCFVTLLNRDVMSFGNNKHGQLGNGKLINNSTPQSILKIIEEKDVVKKVTKEMADSAKLVSVKGKDVNDSVDYGDAKVVNATRFMKRLNNRLQLIENQHFKFANNKGKKNSQILSQVIVAGNENSAIYYTPSK